MWNDTNVKALQDTWEAGLRSSIESRLTPGMSMGSSSAGGAIKSVMPNIVMIDFADSAKCKTIYELNKVAATSITALARKSAMHDELTA